MVFVYMSEDSLYLPERAVVNDLLANQKQLDREEYGTFAYYEINRTKLEKAFKGLLKKYLNTDDMVSAAELGALCWFILSHLEDTNEIIIEY